MDGGEFRLGTVATYNAYININISFCSQGKYKHLHDYTKRGRPQHSQQNKQVQCFRPRNFGLKEIFKPYIFLLMGCPTSGAPRTSLVKLDAPRGHALQVDDVERFRGHE